jgi:glycosyltransferase involved in cell wall biosynthesis
MFERHLASAADAVFAVTPLLAERLRALGAAEAEVLPNGLLPEIAEVGAPVSAPGGEVTVGYFGHLTAAWFDWELVAGAARARPTWKFELIGYGGAPESELPGNVVLLGPRPHRDLAAYAARWDVGIVPFKPGRLAASADPIKTYEYLAMGLPVVVTGVLPPPGGEAFLRRADDLEGFLAALTEEAEAARSRPEAAAERRAFAATCTWAARVDALLAALARRGQRVGEKEELFRMAR